MNHEIRVYNTLKRKKEALKPVNPGKIGMYACGVTPYDENHIGHAMQAIFFDVIRNYLEYVGYAVTYVRNFTDVDDKIIARAASLGISPRALADKVMASSEADLDALSVRPATFQPKVSESIPEIVAMILSLVEKDRAYVTEGGDVYYRVRMQTNYGQLSNRKVEELRAGTRDIAQGDKEDQLDFALWKRDDTPDASWDSPWGRGRPGWHIECSAMSKKYLGDSFDIHGGGVDLVFPHHENEIAQSEAANCCEYAKVWMHSGLLTINKQKMSKSLGNSITIKEFLRQWPAEVLRLSYLQNHYSSPIDFSEEIFRVCRKRLLYYYETLLELDQCAADGPKGGGITDGAQWKKDFYRAMDDDFNTVEAIALMNNLMRQFNASLKKKLTAEAAKEGAALLREWGRVFGLFQREPQQFIAELKAQLLVEIGMQASEIEALIQQRDAARQQKDWARSDQIRDELLKRGILLKDSPQGTSWTVDASS